MGITGSRRRKPNTLTLLFFSLVTLCGLWIWCSLTYLTGSRALQEPRTNDGLLKNKKSSPQHRTTLQHTTFNGYPVTLEQGPLPVGTVDCHVPPLGEEPWKVRSCVYRNLCFDTSTGEFVQATSTNTHDHDVAVGGINPRWNVDPDKPDRNSTQVKWRPTTTSATTTPSTYFQLPDHILLVPFHSMAAHNVGHLLWDDFLAIYSLVRSWFGKAKHQELLLLRYVLPHNNKLYASCDIRRNKRMQCTENLQRFSPLLLLNNSTTRKKITSTKRTELMSNNTTTTTGVVCARQAVAGLGFWTDHGRADHGWDGKAWPSHNIGRGPLLADWSQHHPYGENTALSTSKDVFRITLSIQSSRDESRTWKDWSLYQQALEQWGQPHKNWVVTAYEMKQLTVPQQVRLAQSTHVWITVGGGGSVTATWLPRHAVLIVLYSPTAGLDFAQWQPVKRPTRLDADLWNHASYLRVHWLPWEATSSTLPSALRLVGALVEHEYAVWKQR